ncbi:MAG: hypothetical protein IPL26_22305 [Leptospiraceae bacterium]|nr:hypothetical protein [Leptospiraceae bacterium]
MKATKFYLLLLISFQFLSLDLFSQEKKSPKKQNFQFAITEFTLKSLREESYFVSIESNSKEGLEMIAANSNKVEVENFFPKKDQNLKCKLKIGEFEMTLLDGTLVRKTEESLGFEAYVDAIVPPGKKKVRLFSEDDELLYETDFEVPPRFSGIDSQPFVQKIFPRGGGPGDTISMVGKHLGKDIDSVFVVVLDAKADESHDLKEKELMFIPPIYLGTISDKDSKENLNEVKFTLPFSIIPEKMEGWTFLEKYVVGKNLKMYLLVNHRPSPVLNFTIVPPRWKLTAFLMTVFLLIVFFAVIAFLVGTWNFIPAIILDKETNQYSLSKFQSYLWTIVGIGSYFYIAVCQGVILREGKLPEFSYALLGLMGISYGGLLASSYIGDKKGIKKHTPVTSPSYKNLFCNEDGGIDIPRLQLFAFTMITLILYLANLFWGNALEGLPVVPESLHALLVTSQGGFLGGKYISEKAQTPDSPQNPEPKKADKKEKTK